MNKAKIYSDKTERSTSIQLYKIKLKYFGDFNIWRLNVIFFSYIKFLLTFKLIMLYGKLVTIPCWYHYMCFDWKSLFLKLFTTFNIRKVFHLRKPLLPFLRKVKVQMFKLQGIHFSKFCLVYRSEWRGIVQNRELSWGQLPFQACICTFKFGEPTPQSAH